MKLIRDILWPREHGSWFLVFEPVALGLLVAPSLAGALLAVAVAAAFLARRPLRLAVTLAPGPRRTAAIAVLAACAAVAIPLAAVGLRLGAGGWIPWLAAAAASGAVFAAFDLRGRHREQLPEITGALSFSLLPGLLAVLDSWSQPAALALAAFMLARSIPTILLVRAAVRERKGGGTRFNAASFAAVVGCVGIACLAASHLLPPIAVGLCVALVVGVVLLPEARWLSLREIGIAEAIAGVTFVLIAGLAWGLPAATLQP